MDNRKMLLRQKLKINKQKSLRVTLMSTLPRDMATTIEDCSLITSPELERILDKVQKNGTLSYIKMILQLNTVSIEKNTVGNMK